MFDPNTFQIYCCYTNKAELCQKPSVLWIFMLEPEWSCFQLLLSWSHLPDELMCVPTVSKFNSKHLLFCICLKHCSLTVPFNVLSFVPVFFFLFSFLLFLLLKVLNSLIVHKNLALLWIWVVNQKPVCCSLLRFSPVFNNLNFISLFHLFCPENSIFPLYILSGIAEFN